jgi:hypothetical protein
MLIAFYAGGVAGYYQGSESVSYLTDSEAYTTSLALIKLRDADYQGAIELLETRLDREILQCKSAEDSYQSIYNLYWLVFKQVHKETHGYLLSSVAGYRGKHPSISILPEVRKQVEDILNEASNQMDE